MDWNSKSPTNGVTKNVIGKCSFRILLLPVALLGAIGFLVNYTHITFLIFPPTPCTPKTNVVFLKLHKCASSTIQNVFLRYGDKHNLTFLLPKLGNYLSYPEPFRNVYPEGRIYNMLVHHTRLDYKEIRQVMPEDTVFVTVVRDPVSVFQSSFTYYDLGLLYGMNLKTFAERSKELNVTTRLLKGRYGKNQMMFDLGFDNQEMDNELAVVEYVQKLGTWFDLVLVAERMVESLVLLRERLCWTLDDVVAFNLNALYPETKDNLSVANVMDLRHLNHADQVLYDHFLFKFEREVRKFGIWRMRVESEVLRSKISKWQEFCIGLPDSTYAPYRTRNCPIISLELTENGKNNEFCASLVEKEILYTEYLRQKQNNIVELR